MGEELGKRGLVLSGCSQNLLPHLPKLLFTHSLSNWKGMAIKALLTRPASFPMKPVYLYTWHTVLLDISASHLYSSTDDQIQVQGCKWLFFSINLSADYFLNKIVELFGPWNIRKQWKKGHRHFLAPRVRYIQMSCFAQCSAEPGYRNLNAFWVPTEMSPWHQVSKTVK